MTYQFNAGVAGETRDELEQDGRKQAEEFFGTTNVQLVGGGVTSDQREDPRRPKYEGTLSFEMTTGHPAFDN